MIFEGLFEKSFNDNEILNALSKVFHLSKQNILITNDIYNIDDELNSNIEILCEKSNIKGDFLNKISIYLRSAKLKKSNYIEEEIFSLLSTMLNSQCLISDDSSNPYTMILLKNQERKKVSFVPEDLENEIYTIE